MYATMVEFFTRGGAFMYPIAFVFVLGMTIAIERSLYLTRLRDRSRRLWAQVVPLLQQGNLRQAAMLCQKSRDAIGTVLSCGLARIASVTRRADLDQAVQESLMEVLPRIEKRTHYLATFANAATLLGLLGTISGLISAFTAVANAPAAEKADLLSASISVAMNTTAFGLTVAISLLIMHALIRTRTAEIVVSLEVASMKFLNTVVEQRAPAAASPD